MLSLQPPAQVYFAFILVLLLALSPVHGKTVQEISSLEYNQSVDRELKVGETQFYQFALAAGEYTRVELQTGKARLSLSLLSEKNELITTISDADSPGLKRLDIVADKPTNYPIRVVPENSLTSAAKYQLTLKEKRTATPTNRERFALHRLDWEVVSLYRQQKKSALHQAAVKGRETAARWLALNEPERAGRMLDRA